MNVPLCRSVEQIWTKSCENVTKSCSSLWHNREHDSSRQRWWLKGASKAFIPTHALLPLLFEDREKQKTQKKFAHALELQTMCCSESTILAVTKQSKMSDRLVKKVDTQQEPTFIHRLPRSHENMKRDYVSHQQDSDPPLLQLQISPTPSWIEQKILN